MKLWRAVNVDNVNDLLQFDWEEAKAFDAVLLDAKKFWQWSDFWLGFCTEFEFQRAVESAGNFICVSRRSYSRQCERRDPHFLNRTSWM